MAMSSKPKQSAMASGVVSPWVTAPSTSARAMPIDTAVAATAVDSASAAVVINSISAMGRCGGVGASCASRLLAPRTINLFTMSISTNQLAISRGRCRHRFGRTWAKALANKGHFMFLVNKRLTPAVALHLWLMPG
jgi:hypothetical protein